MPGKTTLHALSFDPSNLQFWAQILWFQVPSKHERCVHGYGMLIFAYTDYVSGFPEGKSRAVCDCLSRNPRTECVYATINIPYLRTQCSCFEGA